MPKRLITALLCLLALLTLTACPVTEKSDKGVWDQSNWDEANWQ